MDPGRKMQKRDTNIKLKKPKYTTRSKDVEHGLIEYKLNVGTRNFIYLTIVMLHTAQLLQF
jgi:hypothetical protein